MSGPKKWDSDVICRENGLLKVDGRGLSVNCLRRELMPVARGSIRRRGQMAVGKFMTLDGGEDHGSLRSVREFGDYCSIVESQSSSLATYLQFLRYLMMK